MPTIISHAAIPLALGVALGAKRVPRRLLLVGMLASMMPDLDVAAFRLGVEYANQFGHRGATHSIAFALILGGLAALLAPSLRAKRWVAAAFVFIACLSHPLLDMCTTGGLGAALWWPFSDQRLFFPAQFIKVSPLTMDRFLGPAGMTVIRSEFLWIWLPCLASMLASHAFRTRLPAFHAASSGIYRPINKNREMAISGAALSLTLAWHFAGDRAQLGAITMMSLITIGRHFELSRMGPDGEALAAVVDGKLLFRNSGFRQTLESIPLADIEQVKVYGPPGDRHFRFELAGDDAMDLAQTLSRDAEQAVIAFLQKTLPEKVLAAKA